MQHLHRRTWAEVDLDAVKHNFLKISENARSMICPVIKADAYGHGAVALARIYEELGAKMLAVSNIDEALQLRNNEIKAPILIFGFTPPSDAAVLSKLNISQCVYSLNFAKQLSKECIEQGVKVNIHIKIDTGMSRLGFYFQESERDFASTDEVKAVCGLDGFNLEGIFTHFAAADDGSDDFTLKQIENFNKVLSLLSEFDFKIKHAANSAAIEDFPTSHFDMVRAGIILYGLSPSKNMRNNLDLKPVLSLKSVISHVKFLKKGSTVSYSRTYFAEKDVRVATVPIGYADGYTRMLSEKGADVLINGKRCPIIGRICMDQLMVLVDEDEKINIGDTVVLIGKYGDECISVDEIAEKRNTINYEVICDLGARVPRVYIKNNEAVDILNYILK